MPIIGRTPAECVNTFRRHVAQLVSKTITKTFPVLVIEREPRMIVSLSDGAAPLPLDTNAGRLFFSLGQALEAVPEGDGTYRLRTLEYWYRLQETADPKGHAFLRWEYMRPRAVATAAAPRHHVHARASVPVGVESLDLNKVHVPTGWVTMEEVIRFLIHELGVKPPCGKAWPGVLAESEEAFYERFTGKRYTAPHRGSQPSGARQPKKPR